MPRSTRGKRAASGPSSSYPDNIRELREEDFKQVSDRTSRLRMQDPYLYQNRSVSRQPDRQERSYYERERTSNAHKAQTARPAAGRSTSRQKTAPQRTQNVGRRTGAILTKQKSRPKRPWETMILPKRKESNFQLISCVVILLLFGLIMVTSSSYYYAYTALGDSMYFFRRQAMWIVVGLLTMFIFAHIPIKWLSRFAWAVYFIALFFQLAVLFVGTEVNGSTRWIQVGPVNFQPSELSKLAMAIIMAYLVEIHKGEIGRLRTFLKLLCVLGLPTILVAVENLSSAMIIAFIGLLIMYIGGCKPRHFIGIVLPLAAILILLIWLPLLVPVESMPSGLGKILNKFMYRSMRIKAWLDPFKYALGDGYQTVQSLYAVGSGGFFGRGLGQSIQKLGYIPEAYNDIIFAIICEELGWFGAFVVIMIFAMFAWNGIRISLYAPDRFTSLLAAGLVGQIVLQAILNIGVNTNSIPPTGVSLPFISYGGSSMFFLMASVGILLDISAYNRQTDTKAT